MNSLWQDSVSMPRFEAFKGNLKTDVLIIGGGIAGILCAYKLAERGVDCALIEASRIAGGVTANTTAKITSQHGMIYGKLLKKFGSEKAELYYKANQSAVEEYRKICKNTDCDFEDKASYIYSDYQSNELEKEFEAQQKLGISSEFCKETSLPFTVWGAIKQENQAQFNPLRFIANISQNLKIYENTKAVEFNGKNIVCNSGSIKAEKIIVATHFPIFNKHGKYFLKLYQQRSYVIAYENTVKPDGMFLEAENNGISLRTSGNYLLLGGGGHRTGKKGEGWSAIERFAKSHFENARPKYRWATQDCITLDGMPYIGEYAKGKSNLLVATGFNKWGMTSSMVAADILADLVVGKENEYAELFKPDRSIIHSQLAVNIFETTASMLTLTAPRCPHLGCALKWNKTEHSWDCSCHGSRFTEEGRLLNNPAIDDLKR